LSKEPSAQATAPPSSVMNSLQRRHLPNLILRHTAARKSQTARTSGLVVDHLNQLNMIHLNKHPVKDKQGRTYVSSPLKAGKTVLVVDDFCTEGNSFEAARAYIERTGARTICLCWLKTINSDYRVITKAPSIVDPYANCIRSPPARAGCRISNWRGSVSGRGIKKPRRSGAS
jgi:hypothetical protein